MASNHTENYGLCQWEATDQVLREEFNEDNAKVDAALGELQSSVASNTAALAKTGTLRFDCFSYVGNGNDEENQLIFPHEPIMFVIQSVENRAVLLANVIGGCTLTCIAGGTMREGTVQTAGNTVTIQSINKTSHLTEDNLIYWVFSLYQET